MMGRLHNFKGEEFMDTLPVTALEAEADLIESLRIQISNLQESNRVILDVFWSASRLARNCDQETLCSLLPQLIQTLESQLKESRECP